MPGTGLERYGLTANPFRELGSETVEDVSLIHINLEIDGLLRGMREEALAKEAHAIVALVGGPGAGKTHRLRLAAAEANERSAFVVAYDIPENETSVTQGVAKAFLKSVKDKKIGGFLGAPAWTRPLSGLARSPTSKVSADEAGRAMGAALSAAAPSVFLLNDLHHLVKLDDASRWLETMGSLADTLNPGVLVMFTCQQEYFGWVTQNNPGFASRINRTVLLRGLQDNEAALLIAKRLLPKRIVEDLDPTYPFDVEAIPILNRAAGGNPRELLRVADLALEAAVNHRSYRIDAAMAESVVGPPPSPPLRADRGGESPLPPSAPAARNAVTKPPASVKATI